jgi:hypothetical protein
MVNYSQAKIYKIIDNTNGNIYVGSTCEPTLARRLANHIAKYKHYLKGKSHFVTSYEIIKNGNYDIILVENVKCDSKDQLTARERYYIETLDCLNKVIPGRTKQQYREDNKEQIQEKTHEYRENNKGKIREYYHDNKEKMKGYQQQYREENKEKINANHICKCGGKYTTANKARHLSSPKHKKYLRNKMIQEYELLLKMEEIRKRQNTIIAQVEVL